MANEITFGRRGNHPQQRALARRPPVREAEPVLTQPAAEPDDEPALRLRMTSSVDEELQQWKQERRKAYSLPWRQLWLLASLFFGLASMVLPDSVNDNVDWLLYGLMGLSFYIGIRTRRKKNDELAKRTARFNSGLFSQEIAIRGSSAPPFGARERSLTGDRLLGGDPR